MQTTFGIIMLALVDRRPQVVNLKEMLDAFVRFRREIATRRTRFDLTRAEERAHILAGLRKAVEHLDVVIRLIRQAESPDAARDALMARLELSEIQARAILDMRLQRLTQLERHKVVEEHEQTLALIEELKGILASDSKLMAIIREELLAVKEEYGDARRTEILTETTELTIEDLLADEEMVVTISRAGYIKRTHVERRPLAKAALGDGQDRDAFLHDVGGDDLVALVELDALHPTGVPARRAHFLLREANDHAEL